MVSPVEMVTVIPFNIVTILAPALSVGTVPPAQVLGSFQSPLCTAINEAAYAS